MKHNFINPIKLCALAIIALVLNSCSLGVEDLSSLSLEIPSEAIARSRNVTLDGNDSSELHVLTVIRGEKTEAQHTTVSTDSIRKGNVNITLRDVPIGETVTIELNLFAADGDWLAYGTSSPFKIYRGTNEIDIKLKQFDGETPYEPIICSTIECNGLPINSLEGMGLLLLDENGFYELIADSAAISKGKWTGNPSKTDGLVYLTEYIYDPISSSGPQIAYSTGKAVICTDLNVYKLSAGLNGYFNFTTKNGVYVIGQFN